MPGTLHVFFLKVRVRRRSVHLRDSLSNLFTFQGNNLKKREQSNLIKTPQQKGVSLGPKHTPLALQWHMPSDTTHCHRVPPSRSLGPHGPVGRPCSLPSPLCSQIT